MKWITREKVKVDRVACPWLIRKFVDLQAEFLFVPASEVAVQATQLGATPFDIEGCELGHHGEKVSLQREFVVYDALYAECQCRSTPLIATRKP
ncbi:MAG: chromate resistance protein [Verrucomicrobia bacterium]|nr:chromate resistance protein [Verrucomicrobiota bacterium]